ncbi:MAG: helix-turn-helix transcriptional regulator [Candidatus Eisenbacteria bacterium]|nr:helix-turn-helix transcriptional regulator [Candidatus Eisenbacteria bacterium]
MTLQAMATGVALASPSGWSRVETGETAMTVGQLRRAARRLGVAPWVLVRQADLMADQLEGSGVAVGDEKPKDVEMGKWLLGGAGLLALIAGAAVAAATKDDEGEDEEET